MSTLFFLLSYLVDPEFVDGDAGSGEPVVLRGDHVGRVEPTSARLVRPREQNPKSVRGLL